MNSARRTPRNASGLTLIELLVVLAILAVLATIAVTSTAGVADQARYEATQHTLENVQDAIMGSPDTRDPGGAVLANGFVSDIGRLPKATAEIRQIDDTSHVTVFTLAELWSNPNGLAPNNLYQAVSPNIDDPTLADPEVYLTTGWRGPYLRLPPGNPVLRDGWGAELVSPGGVSPAFPNALLWTTSGATQAAITSAGQEISQVFSFGANALRNAADTGYDRDLSAPSLAATAFPSASQLSVTVKFQNADGSQAAASSGTVEIRLFGPDPATGRIHAVHETETIAATSSSVSILMPASTPGNRVLRAYYSGSTCAVTPVILLPGANVRTLTLTLASP